ncbi:DUF2357 domain-containing protein [Propionivibrio sp.]|uniref:DUF2357 domain-containing protein n=1 Tax=Propionivibrio sp. TaxID=2212460 RepID=UPI003BF1F63C
MAESLEFLDWHGNPNACLEIYPPESPDNALVRQGDAEAREAGEEPLQLMEGLRYEYAFVGPGAENLRLEEEFGLGAVEPSGNPRLAHCGSIATGLNTGRLALVVRDAAGEVAGRAALEVRSRKVNYRNDYRHMLEDITEHSVALLMDLRAPSAMRVAPEPGRTPDTLHQRFAFLRGLLGSRQFRDALHRITTHPYRRWEPEETAHDMRRGFKPDAKTQRQLARASRRVPLPSGHPLAKAISSLPERISLHRNTQTEDTPENRFIKFALQSFASFLNRMRHKLEEIGSAADARLQAEIAAQESLLETALAADVFRSVSDPDILPLGSPVLQRKEGYREVFQAWLKFDMAARLVWRGGDDVYGAGQRDIATLYEYWVFFKLLDIVSSVFSLEKPTAQELIEVTADGFGLKLKSGEQLAFDGVTFGGARPLRVRFSYNRSFSYNVAPDLTGSWTQRMRPDYSLSLWPATFSEEEAEAQEIMAHVHFDAKYRIDSVEQLFGRTDESLDAADANNDLAEEKQEQREGRYKRADLLKMHAYRDAIRRTQGAYVLYPGDASRQWNGYHEILPGLGAFPLKPGNGALEVESFIREVVAHACDRATARERQSYHTHKAQEAPASYKVFSQLPEFDGTTRRRMPPPSETHVLIGWYKDAAHLKWVQAKKLYNFRMDTKAGSLRLKPEVSGAHYLLLHSYRGKTSSGLFVVSKEGPRVLSKEALMKEGYPGTPSQPFYLVYNVVPAPGFEGFEWDYSKLPERLQNRQSAEPQTVTLDALMAVARENLLAGAGGG